MQCPVTLDDNAGLLPAFSGSVTMLACSGNKTHRLPVVLSIYKTFYEFYAVISQDRVILKDFGYINLKRCLLQIKDDVIKLIPIGRNAHGQTLTFQVASKTDADRISAIFEFSDSDEEYNLAHIENPLDVINETGERTATHAHTSPPSRIHKTSAARPNRNKRKTSLPALVEED